MSSRKRDSPLAYDSLIFLWENLEVILETGQHNCLVIFGLIELPAKQDVILDGIREQNWLLLDIGDRPFNRKLSCLVRHFP